MRVLHTADLHLGRHFNGFPLEADHEVILDQIVAAIAEHRPDVLVIAGDIFDRAAPPASAVRQFNAFLERVARETSAAIVLIAGNHDSGDRIGAMAVLTDRRRALIRGPVTANEPLLILTDEYGPVAFSALPFAYEFAARECFDDERIALPEDVLRAQIAAARNNLPADVRWVIVAHSFVTGARISDNERPLARVGGIETVPIDIFDGAHYVALGHLHRPQSVGREHIRYAGAPLAFGFDEADDVKSMTLVDIDAAGSVVTQSIPFVPLRRVRILRGKLADLVLADPTSDFIMAVLTDDSPLIDPMKRLRAVFPNACQLVYEREEQAREVSLVAGAPVKMSDPVQVIGEFLEQVRGEGLTETELTIVALALHDLRTEESAA